MKRGFRLEKGYEGKENVGSVHTRDTNICGMCEVVFMRMYSCDEIYRKYTKES